MVVPQFNTTLFFLKGIQLDSKQLSPKKTYLVVLVFKPVQCTHLHHHYIFGALALNFRVLNFDRYCSPIMQHCLVDLGQGGCTLRLLLKCHKQF